MAKYIAIGDIHGRYDLLCVLLDKISDDESLKEHTIVFLGDMVDRGPQSFEVVETIKKYTEKGHIALRGNHDNMMLDYYSKKMVDKRGNWYYNGAKTTVDSYCRAMKLYGDGRFFLAFSKSGHYQWMRDLPMMYETDEVWFSHAPIPDVKYMGTERDYRLDRDTLTWSYHGKSGCNEEVFARDHGKVAVCGHVHAVREGIFTPRAYPGKDYHKIVYADTGSGCWRSAPLTGVKIEDGKYTGFLQAVPKGEFEFLPGWSEATINRLRDWEQAE